MKRERRRRIAAILASQNVQPSEEKPKPKPKKKKKKKAFNHQTIMQS
jgi:hypothetical protein